MSRKQIDETLSKYYQHKNVKYYDDSGVGKFLLFCEENGFDTDSIEDELQENPNECTLIEFDEEFPTTQSGDDKIIYIHAILTKCWNDPKALIQSFEIEKKSGDDVKNDKKHWHQRLEAKYGNKFGTFVHMISKLGYNEFDIINAVNVVFVTEWTKDNYDDEFIITQNQMDRIVSFFSNKAYVNKNNNKNNNINIENITQSVNVKKYDSDLVLKWDDIISNKDLTLYVDGDLTLQLCVIKMTAPNLTLNIIVTGDIKMLCGQNRNAVYGKDANINIKCRNLHLQSRISTIDELSMAFDVDLMSKSLKIINDTDEAYRNEIYGNVNIDVENAIYFNCLGSIQSGNINITSGGNIEMEESIHSILAIRDRLRIICASKISVELKALWGIMAQNEILFVYHKLSIYNKRLYDQAWHKRIHSMNSLENIVYNLIKFGYQEGKILDAINKAYQQLFTTHNFYDSITEPTPTQMTDIISSLNHDNGNYYGPVDNNHNNNHNIQYKFLSTTYVKIIRRMECLNIIADKLEVILQYMYTSIVGDKNGDKNGDKKALPKCIVQLCSKYMKSITKSNYPLQSRLSFEYNQDYHFDEFICTDDVIIENEYGILKINVLKDFVLSKAHIVSNSGIILNVGGDLKLEDAVIECGTGQIILNVGGDIYSKKSFIRSKCNHLMSIKANSITMIGVVICCLKGHILVKCNNLSLNESNIRTLAQDEIDNGESINDKLKVNYKITSNKQNERIFFGNICIDVEKEISCLHSALYSGDIHINCNGLITFSGSINIKAYRNNINIRSQQLILNHLFLKYVKPRNKARLQCDKITFANV